MSISSRVDMVRALLFPTSIAIVGSSPARDGRETFSSRAFVRLIQYGFPGAIYPVNPKYDEIWNVKCYPDIASLPEVPDQILVITPSTRTIDIVGDAVNLGVRSAVVYAAGFGEDQTEAGRRRGAQLQGLLENSDLAVCGPNCLAYTSYPADVVLLSEHHDPALQPRHRTVGVVCQSGGVTSALNRKLTTVGVLPRYLVSSGNEVGLTIEDYIEFFVDDVDVQSIALFIETVKDPPRFLALCERAAQVGKPVVVNKIGTSPEAQRATIAHTGRMAGSGRAFADIARAHGVITTRTVDEVVDVLSLYRPHFLPQSRGLGAVTVSGAMRSILLDSAATWRMEFPPVSPTAETALRDVMDDRMTVGNPADIGPEHGKGEVIVACLEHLAREAQIGALLHQSGDSTYLIPRLETISNETNKLIVLTGPGFASFDLSDEKRRHLSLDSGVAYCGSADRAVSALSRLCAYKEWQDIGASSTSATAERPVHQSAVGAEETLRSATRSVDDDPSGLGLLDENRAKELMEAFGLATPRRTFVGSAEQAAHALKIVGAPGVLKVVSASVPHKSELGLMSGLLFLADEARTEYQRIADRCREVLAHDTQFELWMEQAVLGGVECAVGISRDPEFGLVEMFGAGGAMLESLQDVAFALPVTDEASARALISRTKVGAFLLEEHRSIPRDLDALCAVLVTIGSIAMIDADLLEAVDLNPVSVGTSGRGAVLLDASVLLRVDLHTPYPNDAGIQHA